MPTDSSLRPPGPEHEWRRFGVIWRHSHVNDGLVRRFWTCSILVFIRSKNGILFIWIASLICLSMHLFVYICLTVIVYSGLSVSSLWCVCVCRNITERSFLRVIVLFMFFASCVCVSRAFPNIFCGALVACDWVNYSILSTICYFVFVVALAGEAVCICALVFFEWGWFLY